MVKKASVKYRSLRSNLVHLPLSLYASLAQQQARPQGLILHFSPLSPSSSSRGPQEAYAGWSGLAAASSLASGIASVGNEVIETVEVDPEVAMGLGWMEGTIVEISIIHNPTKARSVSVTPLTPDDWEILEQHASFLEENLLSQLRAARKGQEIDFWARGRTKIRIRVDETDPKTDTAVLVHPDTEIYVAPRPRDSSASTEPSQVIDPVSSTSKEKRKVANTRSIRARSVPQYVARCWGTPDIPRDMLDKIGRDKILLCDDGLLRKARRTLGGSSSGPLFVRVELTEPETVEQDPEGQNANDNEKESAAGVGVEGWLIPWDEMPEGCAVFMGKVDDRWNTWSRINLSLAPIPRRGRNTQTHPVPAVELFGTKTTPALASVQCLVDSAISYLTCAWASSQARPLLLTGAKGSGKTSVAQRIAHLTGCNRDVMAEMIYEDIARINGDARISVIKEKMSECVEGASKKRPCILILDNLDTLLPPENETKPSSNPAVLANHFCNLFRPGAIPPDMLVLVTATSVTNFHSMLNNKHIFGETVNIPPPTKEVRQEILKLLVDITVSPTELTEMVEAHSELDHVTLASMTEGYTAADLKDLVGGALQQAFIRSALASETPTLSMNDFASAQSAFTPMSLRGVTLQKSDVKWSDIGGLHEPRRILRETLEWPTKYAQIFANCPLRLRSGLLLYGYPGCGKTLLASAVAKECGLNFISVKGPEILNKYIGASEKAVRDLFERASAAKPCVLFFDEFDSIAPKRGHDSTGVTDRVVNQMLTEMDGVQGLKGVYILAATSRPDLIDPALLRPGRLDKSILCDMPSAVERREILQALSTKLTFAPSVDLDALTTETEGFSGADLQAMVYNAYLEVVQSSILEQDRQSGGNTKGKEKGKGNGKEGAAIEPAKMKMWKLVAPINDDLQKDEANILSTRLETILSRSSGDTGATLPHDILPTPIIKQRHLQRSLNNTRPSGSVSDRTRLERIYRAFVSDRDGSMANGDLGRDTGTRVSLM